MGNTIRVMCCGVMMALLLFGGQARALDEAVLNAYVADAKPVGGGTLTFLFWDAYDAELVAPAGVYNPQKPFALTLTYKVEIVGADIAERSVEEMRKIGVTDEEALKRWGILMHEIFPDVEDGERLTGIRNAKAHTVFYNNDTKIAEIKDVAFTEAFFGIWLHENTSGPGLRKKLLGVR